MPLLRSEYLEHLRRAVFRAVTLAPETTLPTLLPGLIDYVARGNLGTVAERREAVRIMINAVWQQLLSQGYNGHQMKHWLVQNGVDPALAEEPPNLAEPVL